MKLLMQIALLSLLVALGTTGLVAQISLGIRGGTNLSKWVLNDEAKEDFDFIGVDRQENISALLIGALVEIRPSSNFAIQPEVNFIQKGTKSVFAIADPDITELNVVTMLDYLEVPLMLKVGTGFGVGRFDVLVGPSFGYALSGKRKAKAKATTGRTVTMAEDIDFDESGIRRVDVGSQVGASLGLGLGSVARLFVDGRYLLSFSNLVEDEQGGGEMAIIRNRGVALTAGVLFSF